LFSGDFQGPSVAGSRPAARSSGTVDSGQIAPSNCVSPAIPKSAQAIVRMGNPKQKSADFCRAQTVRFS